MITCPQCGITSHNPNDERERYCGNCHQFHEFLTMKKINLGRIDGSTIEEPCAQLADLLKSIQGSEFDGAEIHAEVLHFSRSDGIDIFVVSGETRDKMRAQLPKDSQ